MTEEERRALPWYGGNKIPDSYLAKFMPKREHEDLPHDLRVFLAGMGVDNRPLERHTDQHE